MLKLSGKFIKVILVLAVMGFLCVVLICYLFPGKPDILPPVAISQALNNTAKASSYEYIINMSTFIDGKEQIASKINGERQNQHRIHIKGQILGSAADFYLIDAVTYTKDQLTGKWLKISDQQINQQEIFKAELNPLTNFGYKKLNEARFHGFEKINGKKYWIYTASPVIENPYMEMLWRNFQYKFWLEPHSLRIYKAQATAENINNPSVKLNLSVEFYNYNRNIKIMPPI